MNNREKAKALEDVLEFALRTDTESCHRHGLCGYVSFAADNGVIADEDKGAVYDLIRDLMNSVKQSIQSRHYDSDFSFSYLIEALHIKHDIPFDDRKRLQKVWVEEYRDFIAQLRQDDKPHLRPKLPYLAVDTPVLVRDSDDEEWYPRHFHSFGKDGRIHAWNSGCTQHTASSKNYHCAWGEWKLPDEE